MALLKQLRISVTTASAAVAGCLNLLSGGGERHPVVLKPGDIAPDFHLLGSDGRWYRLRDFSGRDAVVIAWFPKAFTAACTRECESIGSSRGALRGFKVRYFGASVDTAETNKEFAESLAVDFPILSDPDKAVARAYGVLRPTGFPARWTFYIGKDGRILDVDSHVRPLSHGADVAGRLAALGVPTAQQ